MNPLLGAVALTGGSVGAEIGVDPEVILQTAHGRRTIDTLKIVCPEKANWKCESHAMNFLLIASITNKSLTQR